MPEYYENIQDRNTDSRVRDMGRSVMNWLQNLQNLDKTYKRGKQGRPLHSEPLLSHQGLALQLSPQVSSFVIQIGLEFTV